MTADRDDLIAAAKRAFTKPFGGVIRLEPEGGAAVWVDGRQTPPRTSPAAPKDLDAAGAQQCAWRASHETLIRILADERLVGSDYLSGRLAIAGDMSVMARARLERTGRG